MKRAHSDADDSGATSPRPAPVRAETGHASMPERQRLAIGRLAADRLGLSDIIGEPSSRLAHVPKDIVGIVFGWYLRDIAVNPPPGPFASSVVKKAGLTRVSSDYGCDCFKRIAHSDACGVTTRGEFADFCTKDCTTQPRPSPMGSYCRATESRLFASGPDLIVVKGGYEAVCVIANIWTEHEVHCRYPVHMEARRTLAVCVQYGRCTAKRHEDGSIVFHTGGHRQILTLFVDPDGCLTCNPCDSPDYYAVCRADKYWIDIIGSVPKLEDFISQESVAYTVYKVGSSVTIVRTRPGTWHVAGTVRCLRQHDKIRMFNDIAGNVCIMLYEPGILEHSWGTKFIWLRRNATYNDAELEFVLVGTTECANSIVNETVPAVIDQAGRLCTFTLQRVLTAICPDAPVAAAASSVAGFDD